MTLNAHQFKSDRSGKLWIQSEQVYGPLNLVGDALAGAVVVRPEFQVLDPIVVSHPVDVVDGFLGSKLPSDVLLHDVAVFKDGGSLPGATEVGGNRDPHIAATLELLDSGLSAELRAAGGAAQLTAPSDNPIGLAAEGHGLAALDARRGAMFGGKTPTDVATSARAVKRRATELLDVRAKGTRLSVKRLAAFLAGKFLSLNDAAVSAELSLVCMVALRAAKAAVLAWFGPKSLAAADASNVNGHVRPLPVWSYDYHSPVSGAIHFCSGNA